MAINEVRLTSQLVVTSCRQKRANKVNKAAKNQGKEKLFIRLKDGRNIHIGRLVRRVQRFHLRPHHRRSKQ
jgi:hypothetical protein